MSKSLCKMNSNGETSTNWYGGQIQLGPMGSTGVDVITEVPGGNGYYIGGNFTTPANRICKLDLGGNLVASFGSTGYDAQVLSIVPYTSGSGSIICGGGFQNYAGAPSNRIARLSTTGVLDASFTTGSGFNAPTVLAKAVSGKVYCAGSFTSYNGVARAGVARLNTEAPALLPVNTVQPTLSVGSGTEARMTVWPNPSEDGPVSIQLSDLGAEVEHADLMLFDALGKQIMVQRLIVSEGRAQLTLMVNDLPTGIYSIVLLAGSKTSSQRLILG
ncbi:MAG: T9SS type A sorting domain-containing protein [Flavobacteriales bacterium]|nr:T9SS type A sorting domain-containing protein [Flavobacteriales bacterium]